MGQDKKETFSLEKTFEELEKVVKRLESDETSLEESFTSYKKGIEMVESCNGYIDRIEKKVRMLNEEGEQNEF